MLILYQSLFTVENELLTEELGEMKSCIGNYRINSVLFLEEHVESFSSVPNLHLVPGAPPLESFVIVSSREHRNGLPVTSGSICNA